MHYLSNSFINPFFKKKKKKERQKSTIHCSEGDRSLIGMGSRGNCRRKFRDRANRQTGLSCSTWAPDLHVECDEGLVHRNRRNGLEQGPDAAGGQCG